MQVGERKLLAPQMHSITITLRVHCWSLLSTHREERGQRGLGIERDEGERRFSKECVVVNERKQCIKEAEKKTDVGNGKEGNCRCLRMETVRLSLKSWCRITCFESIGFWIYIPAKCYPG